MIEEKGDEKMGVFVVETYVIKQEKQREYMPWMRRFRKYMKEKPELFKEVKSLKFFTQTFGGVFGGYVILWEFDSMGGLEKAMNSWFKDKGMVKITEEFKDLLEPTAHSLSVWNSIT